MKNLSLLFIAILLIQFTTLAQEGWFQQTSGTTEGLKGVSFTDSDNGTTVGEGGTILRTTDGGTKWTLQTSGTSKFLKSVSFTDSNNGTIVGGGGRMGIKNRIILRTTNGGTTWITQISDTTEELAGVSFTDSAKGTAVGKGGIILRTTNGGVTFVEEEKTETVLTEFLLSQNYPNPLNPNTKIKYSVPQTSNVVIKVFDILGKEIETLVDEEKNVGTYEINWYADNLPSGIYFYRLKAGSFVETKKMLMIK